jgi:MFS family permease
MDTPDPTPDDVAPHDFPPPTVRSPGRPFVTAAFVLAVAAAITIVPLFTGPLAVVLAMVGRRKGDEERGKRAIIAAVVGMAIGIAVNAVLLSNDG